MSCRYVEFKQSYGFSGHVKVINVSLFQKFFHFQQNYGHVHSFVFLSHGSNLGGSDVKEDQIYCSCKASKRV